MRILTEQELRRAVDGTVRRTLAENSQDEGIGKWLLGGAAALLGLRYWPQIKSFLYGQGDNGGQTPPQGQSAPTNGTEGGSTDTNPPSSGGSSDGRLEDWQKEWRNVSGQNKPSSNDAPSGTRPESKPNGGPSDLDKVDAVLSNPMALRQLSREEIRLLLMYRMMLSSDNNGYPNNGYARGHSQGKTRASRSTTRTSAPSSGYAPRHRMN